jgi:hypothetical protein
MLSNVLNNYLTGVPIIIDYDRVIKTQRRKHKKKRINKKWLKRYGYKVEIYKSYLKDGQVVNTPNGLFMNQRTYDLIKLGLLNQKGEKEKC